MKKQNLLFTFILGAFISCSPTDKTTTTTAPSTPETPESPIANTPKLSNQNDSISYGLGISIAQNISNQGLNDVNSEKFAMGLDDYLKGSTPLISIEEANKMLNDYFVAIQKEKNSANIEKGKQFLAENSKKEGVVSLPSGLQYKILKQGTGPKPTIDDKVSTHYHGTLLDGTVFDSSIQRGEPATFPLNGVIKGWTEALQLMPVGSKWELYIPSTLAYGERGAGGSIGPHATLIFQVELLSIEGK